MLQSAIALDARLSQRLRIAEDPGGRRLTAAILAHSGDSWFWGAALLIIWLLSGTEWKRWAIIMLAAISVLAVLVLVLKFLVRRRRPEGEWGSIYRNTDPHSFPSGHAARAFLIAVLAASLGPNWLSGLLWIWAPFVSLARVAMGVHYLSDVVAGCVLGIMMGAIAATFAEPALTALGAAAGLPLW